MLCRHIFSVLPSDLNHQQYWKIMHFWKVECMVNPPISTVNAIDIPITFRKRKLFDDLIVMAALNEREVLNG